MREIKFRAWCNKRRIIIKEIVVGEGFIGEQWEDNVDYYQSKHDADLIPMQYTGLKDKNGVDIYEGDIVKVLEHYEGDTPVKEFNGKVAMLEGSWWVENKQGFGVDVWEYCHNHCGGVIGNIYENPELLTNK